MERLNHIFIHKYNTKTLFEGQLAYITPYSMKAGRKLTPRRVYLNHLAVRGYLPTWLGILQGNQY